MTEPDPCPCESVVPPDAPGKVEDHEVLVRFVSIYDHLDFSDGSPRLTPASVTQSDLAGKGTNSASVIREEHIDVLDLRTRAIELTRYDDWKTDPVVGRSLAGSIRSKVNEVGRRRLCVNADPTKAENDRLGACPAHASIVKAVPYPVPDNSFGWLKLRTAFAECFEAVLHLSQAIPIQRPIENVEAE